MNESTAVERARIARVPPIWFRSVFAILTVAVATGVRFALDSVFENDYPFVTYLAAVAAVAWFGRTRAAILTLVGTALLAKSLFILPRYTLIPMEASVVMGIALYLAVGSVIIAMSHVMRAAKRKAEHLLAEAVVRRDELQRSVLTEAEHRERLRTTLASIGDAVISTDADGNVTYLNSVAVTLTGWSNDEAAGLPLTTVFNIVNESTGQPVENPVSRAMRDGVVVGLANHTILIAKDGRECPIDDSAAPIRARSGEVTGCVLVFRDISDKKRLEREREEAQDRVVATLESITDAFMRLDRDWRIVYVNAEAVRLTGRQRSELLGHNHWDMFPAMLGTLVESEFRRARAEQTTVEFEHFFVPLNHWFAVKCDPTPDGGLAIFFRDVTERKHSETVLRQSEARFRAAIGAVSSLIWTNNAEGMMAGEQPGWANFTGQDRAGYEGYGWSRAVHPDDAQPTIDAWNVAVAAKKTFIFEHRVRRHDGQWRLCSIRAVPVLDSRGEVEEWVGVHNDITDQREAEQQLRRSEARFRRLFESNVVGMIQWDLDRSLILDANETFLRLTGYTREDLAAGRLNFRDMTPPEWTPRNEEGIHSIQTGGFAIPYEKEYYRKDGTRVPLIIAGTRFEDSPSEGMSLLIDLTDRKNAEREIARLAAEADRERRLFGTALSNTADFIYTFDLNGRFTFANSALLNMLGRDLQDVVGKNFHELDYQPAVAERLHRQVLHVIETRRPVRDETPFTGTAGERQYEYIFVPVLSASGAVEAVAGSTRDITDRKGAEEELRRLAADLSDADRRKDEFLATLAHELRNPLAPIRNGLQVIRMAGADGTVELARSMMDRQLTQLVRLVDDLLDVSRVTSGKLELRLSRIELRTVIDAALESSHPIIEQAGHELGLSVPDEPVFVHGDHTRLAQVVSNLLNNSAKYTLPGGCIVVTVRRDEGMAVISVVDNGIGIPPNMLGKVFGMFAQVDRALEKTTGGLGIGLSLVKGLVELHGGTIEARSEGEGRGSEFVVRLPELTVAEGETPQAGDPVTDVVPTGVRRILVVDDNVDAADSLGQILEMLGNEVRTAYDGEAGLQLACEFRPAVILMDIGMPKVNGYDAARNIRAESWGKDVMLVALTGWGQEDDRKKSSEAGFNHHLVKPVEPEALLKVLADCHCPAANTHADSTTRLQSP